VSLEIRKGSELLGRYVISDLLGSGGFGVVWRATDKKAGRDVAIKRLLKKGDPVESGRLKDEASRVARLKGHKNIVEVYECFQEDGEDFLLMEYVDGKSLQDTIRAHIRTKTWFDIDEALDYFTQIVEGLLFAHSSGLYNRDVKPSNILVSNLGVIKLVDFGIARPMVYSNPDNDPIQVGLAHTGTLNFMSPEQASGGSMNHLTDIFSAGIVGYILITGRHPFNHPSGVTSIVELIKEPTFVCEDLNSAVVKGVSPDICKVIGRMLCKEMSSRIQSLIQVLNELTQEATQSYSKCGSPNPMSNSYCGQCGTPLHLQVAAVPLPGKTLESAEELTDEGFIEARRGNWEEAIRLYRRALAQDPAYARAHSNLGFSLNKLGKYDEAINVLTQGLVRAKDTTVLARLHDTRGFSRSSLKDYVGAIEDFTMSLQYNRYNPKVLYHRAESKALAGLIDSAIHDVISSLQIAPDLAPAMRLRQKLESIRLSKPVPQPMPAVAPPSVPSAT